MRTPRIKSKSRCQLNPDPAAATPSSVHAIESLCFQRAPSLLDFQESVPAKAMVCHTSSVLCLGSRRESDFGFSHLVFCFLLLNDMRAAVLRGRVDGGLSTLATLRLSKLRGRSPIELKPCSIRRDLCFRSTLAIPSSCRGSKPLQLSLHFNHVMNPS